MGGVARLARELGIEVTGSDANTYPPMSTQLEKLGIELMEGYSATNIPDEADWILVGNTISRGNPELEYVLEKGLKYTSGAQWLSQHILQDRWVLAVAGTHGKTTTSSILTWLLHANGLAPGYLIGGVPENFGESSRLGETPFFVIEADEYDTAFSDKRSKFLHYPPRTLVLNNLEFDHADIFTDLEAIKTQFNHLLKIVPNTGLVIHNRHSIALDDVIACGIWSEHQSFGIDTICTTKDWQAIKTNPTASEFIVKHNGVEAHVKWPLIGEHNMQNALAAVAAAHHVGIPITNACESLAKFQSVKRRMELIYEDTQVRVFDDFAHHPTAIAETLNALRNSVGDQAIIAILEPRSNTMKRGVHKDQLAESLRSADDVMIFADNQVLWDISELSDERTDTFNNLEALQESLIEKIATQLRDCSSHKMINILIMSNGSFGGLHQNIITHLKS